VQCFVGACFGGVDGTSEIEYAGRDPDGGLSPRTGCAFVDLAVTVVVEGVAGICFVLLVIRPVIAIRESRGPEAKRWPAGTSTYPEFEFAGGR